MSTEISMPGFYLALTLPWLCGAVWVNWLLRPTGRHNAFIVLGQGFFLGIFLTTLVIRLWDAAGFELAFRGIAGAVAAFTALGMLLNFRQTTPARNPAFTDPVPAWQHAVAVVLVGLVAWRYLTLVQELLLRPVYAWDAWMNWTPKAIVWFHNGSLVDFVNPEQWASRQGADAYTLGNRQANSYPVTVPLLELWDMLGLGTWDHSLIYLPWILAPLALGSALFGHLRSAGVPYLPAVVACYLLLDLPYLNVHAVLAGYADIWLASVFALAVCAVHEWRLSRHRGYAVLWIVLALMCGQLKNPGVVLGLIILLCGIRAWFAIGLKLEAALLAVALVLLAIMATVGVSMDIPGIGRVALEPGLIEAGKLGSYALEYHDVGEPFLQSFFVQINWNLLWYAVLPFLCYHAIRSHAGSGQRPANEFRPVLAALVFIAFVFIYTKYYRAAWNFHTLNRVVLYTVPVLIYCMFLCLGRQEPRGPDLLVHARDVRP